MNTTEIKRPSNLTEEDRADTIVLIEAFKKIPDELGKKIALAYSGEGKPRHWNWSLSAATITRLRAIMTR